jgi:hypothetical protein
VSKCIDLVGLQEYMAHTFFTKNKLLPDAFMWRNNKYIIVLIFQ